MPATTITDRIDFSRSNVWHCSKYSGVTIRENADTDLLCDKSNVHQLLSASLSGYSHGKLGPLAFGAIEKAISTAEDPNDSLIIFEVVNVVMD